MRKMKKIESEAVEELMKKKIITSKKMVINKIVMLSMWIVTIAWFSNMFPMYLLTGGGVTVIEQVGTERVLTKEEMQDFLDADQNTIVIRSRIIDWLTKLCE